MAKGLPGLAGTDHVGFTVPDIEAATKFFVDVIGCEVIFDIGPFQADDDWMEKQLSVHPRSVIKTIRMLKCKNGPAFEIFEYDLEGANQSPPANSDVGGHHLAFYVDDIDAAVSYLKEKGVTVQGEVIPTDDGPAKGRSWVYFLSPWGMQLELVSYPEGMGYEANAREIMWSPKS